MEDRETARMHKYGESKMTRIMMATVPHVTSGLGFRKFQAEGFLLTRVYLSTALHGVMSQQTLMLKELDIKLYGNKTDYQLFMFLYRQGSHFNVLQNIFLFF